MAAYGAGDQVAASVPTGSVAGWGSWNLPNFVGELFRLSPMETPLLTMIGGLTGGESLTSPVFTWQDTIHRAPALQSVPEGDDPAYAAQKRNERSNVVAIHQYGVELSYTKQATTGLLGTSGTTPATAATSILGNQPVSNEMAWQLQIKLEQAALDVELMLLTGTLAYPNDGTARQTQGIEGAVSSDTRTDYTLTSGKTLDRAAVNDIMQKLYDNGAPRRDLVLMVGSTEKLDLEASYAQDSSGWNLEPRSRTEFGVNVQDLETAFGRLPIVINRHLTANSALWVERSIMNICFLPIPGRGHFFLEAVSKGGAYDRMQLYGEIGLKYGPSGWHGRAFTLHQP